MKWLIILCFLPCCLSALEFTNTKVHYDAKISDSSYTAQFSFVNKSNEKTVIEKLTPSCNCIAPELSKNIYEKGEKGTIKLKFDFRNKLGPQVNRLLVYLKDQKKPITLVLEVDIPKPYTYSKRFLIWKALDYNEKKITMTIHKDLKVKVSLITLPQDFPFKVNLIEIENGEYDISMKPQKSISKGRYKINLKIEEKDKRPKTSSLYLLIK